VAVAGWLDCRDLGITSMIRSTGSSRSGTGDPRQLDLPRSVIMITRVRADSPYLVGRYSAAWTSVRPIAPGAWGAVDEALGLPDV